MKPAVRVNTVYQGPSQTAVLEYIEALAIAFDLTPREVMLELGALVYLYLKNAS